MRKQSIKDAAYILFANKGFAETSTEDLANAVGLKKQSLYSHFENKNQIITEVIQDQYEMINNQLYQVIIAYKDSGPETLLKEFLDKIMDVFIDRERLLIFKRILLVNQDDGNFDILKNLNFGFDSLIIQELANIITSSIIFQDPENMRLLFIKLMIFINGYLDLMLAIGHNDSDWQQMRDSFWACNKQYFKLC